MGDAHWSMAMNRYPSYKLCEQFNILFCKPVLSHHLNFSVNLHTLSFASLSTCILLVIASVDTTKDKRIFMPKWHMFLLWWIRVGYYCINGATTSVCWCLGKPIHWKGENAMSYSIALEKWHTKMTSRLQINLMGPHGMNELST